jgi:hypothetical protein
MYFCYNILLGDYMKTIIEEKQRQTLSEQQRSALRERLRKRHNASSQNYADQTESAPPNAMQTVEYIDSNDADSYVFHTGVCYAIIMEALSGYIRQAESFRIELANLNAEEIVLRWNRIHSFHMNEWARHSEIYASFSPPMQREFSRLFRSVNTVLSLQFWEITEKRARELNMNNDALQESPDTIFEGILCRM